jgi:hypothetical protein
MRTNSIAVPSGRISMNNHLVFDHREIGAVSDERRVHAEDMADCGVDLY